MRVLCAFGQHCYGDPHRGESYEYTNFTPALRYLGHEVVFFESWNRSAYSGFRELNAALLKAVDQHRPDVIFSVMFTFEIWMETWQILRDAGIAATVNWTTDDSWKYNQFSRHVAPAFHAMTTTYPKCYAQYQRDGFHNVLLTQWAASITNLQRPLRAAECRYDVSFVGTAHGRRRRWVNELRKRGIAVECFGHGWSSGPVEANRIPQIIRSSVISLNYSNSALRWDGILLGRENQIKARTFEVPGAGGFLLAEWAEGLERFYMPDREIAVFRDIDELAEKIRYYLANPAARDAVAQAGYKRTCAEHTYDKRLAPVLEFALEQKGKYFSRKGKSASSRIDIDKFESAARSHTLNIGLKLFRKVLVGVFSAIWGSVRGPRAARRLIFELSWRLAGKRTYSAVGWPGRMFYSEN